jgi:hypothetical protein
MIKKSLTDRSGQNGSRLRKPGQNLTDTSMRDQQLARNVTRPETTESQFQNPDSDIEWQRLSI